MRLTWPVVFIISSTPHKLSSLHLTYLQPTWWIQVLGKSKELDQTLALEFSRQEYWSGLPFPSPGNRPNPGIEPHLSCLLHWQVGSLPPAPSGKPRTQIMTSQLTGFSEPESESSPCPQE